MEKKLYFIAVVPGAEISREVTAFKEYAAEQFDASRALNAPPHITLIPPFWWPLQRQRELEDAIVAFALREHPFLLTLNSFNCFRPRVIFVDVAPNNELKTLQAGLKQHLADRLGLAYRDNHGFHPHMTVAFKDLKARIFPDAWAYFSKLEYQRYFSVTDLVLLKFEEKKWVPVRRAGLKQ